jgi:uncharacterized membrane protein
MKYTVEMGSGVVIYTPSCIKIGLAIQMLMLDSIARYSRETFDGNFSQHLNYLMSNFKHY